NGSGKSTLAKLLAGIYKPGRGQVLLMGADTRKLTLGEIGQRIGYLWQKPEQQLFAHTVLEELLFVGRIKNPKQSAEERRAAEQAAWRWLEYFEIAHLAERSGFFLSRGEKQRLALAAVVSQGVKYLVLDEPTSGLDEKRKDALIAILRKLQIENGVGMTVISHDQKFIRALAEREILLDRGEVAHERKTSR
ncbi:MAG: energy-coupling factor ABC transporter ATP-binding protein, partial [Clostridiales bacterium]|nr:energy-coupling factor ABC transporter ATP-binding protein [Clostridiales bacterium]